jgi:hypothetical protein
MDKSGKHCLTKTCLLVDVLNTVSDLLIVMHCMVPIRLLPTTLPLARNTGNRPGAMRAHQRPRLQ